MDRKLTFGSNFMLLLLVVSGMQTVFASPKYRVKRGIPGVSDMHLSDLESRIALNNNHNRIAITMPVGGGLIDPGRIGRKRRSQARFFDVLFNQSEEDNGDYDTFLERLRSLN